MDTCGYCGDSQGTLLYRVPVAEGGKAGNGFRLLRCSQCSLVYLVPRLSPEEIAPYYSEAYYAKDKLRLKSLLEDDVRGFRRADRVERHAHGGEVLDVGCGGGKFLATLNHYSWRKHGLELSELAAAQARQLHGIDVRVATLSDAGFRDNYFDVVTLWHVFEHIATPGETLNELRRILKPGGLLLVAVPNFASLESRLTRANWYHLDVPRHYYHYTAKTLCRMMETSGFQVNKVRHFALKNWYGFLQSTLNGLGFSRNLVRDCLGKRLHHVSWKQKAQIAATVAVLPVVTAGTLIATLLESALGMGGTIEVYATKR